MSPPSLSDREAISLVRAGDQAGFRVLVERYQARALRVAARVLRDEEQARDAVQEALLKAYASLDRFEGRSSFYTWLYRLVVNVCLDMRRRDRSARHVEFAEGGAIEAARGDLGAPVPSGASGSIGPTGRPRATLDWERESPAFGVERAELREALAKAIERLSDGQRETLILREVEGLSYAEIATALDISKGTVMSRLHYARRKVQHDLLASGVLGPTAHGDVEIETPNQGDQP